jgi:hypothetical protein
VSDTDVLRSVGVTDFEPYAVSPGQSLARDIFLDDEPTEAGKPQFLRTEKAVPRM